MFSGKELVINMQNDLMNLNQKLKTQYILTKYGVLEYHQIRTSSYDLKSLYKIY